VTLDCGWTDFRRLYAVHRQPASFVIRAKRNLRCRRLSPRPVPKPVRADQTLTTTRSREAYPEALRRVSTGIQNSPFIGIEKSPTPVHDGSISGSRMSPALTFSLSR